MRIFLSANFFLISWAFALENETANPTGLGLGEIRMERGNLTLVECETDDDCEEFIEGSKCEKKICKCPNTWLVSRDRTKCLKPAEGFDSACEEDIQCSEALFAGGICLGKACKCKTGYHYLKGACWKSKGLKDKCLASEQCFSTHDYRGNECRDKICRCRQGYYNRFDSACRKTGNLGDACNLDSDCLGGNECEKRKCEKPKGKRTAIPAIVEEESTVGIRYDKAEDNLNCSRGEYELEGKCVLELGMKCDSDADCKHIAKAKCMENVCSCEPVLAIASENNRKCLQVARGKVPNISQSICKEDRQCSVFGENSFCLNKKCACKNGTYWESENQFCWKVRGLNENCSADRDCRPSETHAECKEVGGGGENAGKVCRCQDGYHAKEDVCIPDATKVGDYCEDDDSCLFENSFCDNSTCQCGNHFYPEGNGCLAGIGSSCEDDDQCAHMENAKCLDGNSTEKFCLCEIGHVQSDDFKYCLPVGQFGKSCIESFQCKVNLGEFSKCFDGICRCTESSHHYEGRCYPNRLPGESCTRKQECFLNGDEKSTICLNGHCSCHYDYLPDGMGNCTKIRNSASGNFKIHQYLLIFALVILAN